jgi:histidinol-phosphate/aromatic aminotransferase/cobyric acid decarboxylase-like protein
VSLTAQLAAVQALQSSAYYAEMYARTDALRQSLAGDVCAINPAITTVGTGNFLLCHLPDGAPDAVIVEARCRSRGLFIRDISRVVPRLGPRVIRLAVKDAITQRRMLDVLTAALGEAIPGALAR